MNTIVFLLGVCAAGQSFASALLNCPKALQFYVSDINKAAYEDSLNFAASFEEVDSVSFQHFYQKDPQIHQTMVLENVMNSACHYISVTSRLIKGGPADVQMMAFSPDHIPAIEIDYNFKSQEDKSILFKMVSMKSNLVNFSGSNILVAVEIGIRISGRKIADKLYDADITIGTGILNFNFMPSVNQGDIDQIENKQDIIDCGYRLSVRGMNESIGENENSFGNLRDPAAIAALRWVGDVLAKDIGPIKDCEKRSSSFYNLRKLLRSMSARFQNSASPDDERNSLVDFLEILNKTQNRLWLINHAEY